MQLNDLFDFVEKSEDLEGVGVSKWGVIIKHKGSGLCTQVSLAALDKIERDDLQSILTGKREPDALKHITRIVGYYSRVENWNKSKLGELKARHKGHYSIQEQQTVEGVSR